ncbi:hypothetical protein PoB_006643000 [Plakobranchus ocellatus]|uniref:Uncharacterized protein n=1 Tax=Plakobranchus ocellatus TaxID=259542 RepID=A0AAV4D724_9GAST|nr:hypothetical protein PoB_006643000 [Plakobranchus ocellatus]
MESTSERYANFMRQCKKRHSFAHFQQQYKKYERCAKRNYSEKQCGLAMGKSKDAETLNAAVFHENLKARFSSCCERKTTSTVNHHPRQKIVTSPKPGVGVHHVRVDKVPEIKKSVPLHKAKYTSHKSEKETNCGRQDDSMLQKKNYSLGNEEFPQVKDCQETKRFPSMSPNELTDMEFWLLYGNGIRSATSHFSYALLAHIDHLLDVPAGSQQRSYSLKTDGKRAAGLSTIGNTTHNISRSGAHRHRLPLIKTRDHKKRECKKPQRKENVVYWNHDSNCADKYRLHILKFIKKTSKSYGLEQSDEAAHVNQDLIAQKNNQFREESNEHCSQSCQICITNSPSVRKNEIRQDYIPLKSNSSGRVIKLQDSSTKPTRDKTLPKKVMLNSEPNRFEIVSSAASTLNHELQTPVSEFPSSAQSSVTVYLPRCPPVSISDSDRQRTAEEDAMLKKEEDAASYTYMERESQSQKETLWERREEQQDIISVSIRVHQKHHPNHSVRNFTAPLKDEIYKLRSTSSVDSQHKCKLWLSEKCPK